MNTTSHTYNPEAQRSAYEATWETARTEERALSLLSIDWTEDSEETNVPLRAEQLHNGRPYLR